MSSEFLLDHTAISVSSLKESINFYERIFGFKCIKKFYIETLNANACFLKINKFILEVFEFINYNPLPNYRKTLIDDLKTIGVKHFAFKVDNIEKIYYSLKEKKVDFATDIRLGGSGLRYFFIKDPDGILVEIIENEEATK